MQEGKVVAKKCLKCGHHEIGIEDRNGEYTQLKLGTNVIIYNNDEIETLKKVFITKDRRYEQLKVAIQDLFIEIGITANDLKSIAARADYDDDHIGAKVTVKVAQKLLDAGILEYVRES
jgi:uncharacterized OB-fold protein